MPLNLHSDCRARLHDMLAVQLEKVSVSNGIFLALDALQHLSPVEAVLPATGKIRENIVKYIGESPILDFVGAVLAKELSDNCEFSTAAEQVPLKSIPDYFDLFETSERLIRKFDSLPWDYMVTIALPAELDFFSAGGSRIAISEKISIRRGDDVAHQFSFSTGEGPEKKNHVNALAAALLGGVAPSWSGRNGYLQISVEGFIGKYTTTEPLLDAISNLRAFFGLGIALRLFKPSYVYQPYPKHERIYIHRRVDSLWRYEEDHQLDLIRSNVVNGLKFELLDGTLDTDELRLRWISIQLSAISSVFKSGARAGNLLLGAQWLLDSYSGSDEMLQFVQAAVVIEILLGDKASSDQVGLGELLSNRCAYLIAHSHAQRAEVLRDFRKIYEVRSKIVHRGKSRLNAEERALFDTLRWLCARIIQEDVRLLRKDADSGL